MIRLQLFNLGENSRAWGPQAGDLNGVEARLSDLEIYSRLE